MLENVGNNPLPFVLFGVSVVDNNALDDIEVDDIEVDDIEVDDIEVDDIEVDDIEVDDIGVDDNGTDDNEFGREMVTPRKTGVWVFPLMTVTFTDRIVA